MDFEQVLRNALENIRSKQLKNEAQTKQAVILPILRALGWDDTNPSEFVPEFAVGTESGRGSVDYALFSNLPTQHPLIFVETKSLGNIDDSGEGQLFRYAANQGVPLLVLTDGDIWNFYLAMAAGEPAKRIVYRAKLSQEEKLSEYEGFFKRYLEKSSVLSGKARQDAERDKESEANRLTAQNAIPSSWQGLLNEPNEELQKLLVEAVEKNCGIRPELEDVRSFLRSPLSMAVAHRDIEPKPIAPSVPVESKPIIGTTASRRSKIVGFELDGTQHKCRDGISTIAEVLKEFQRRDYTFLGRLAPKTIGHRRRLVSQERDGIHSNPSQQGLVRDLENGWWMNTSLSSNAIEHHIKLACEVAGIGYGTQLKLLER